MPYCIYRIIERPLRQLTKLEQHAVYREASLRAKALRKEEAWGENSRIKMIFAENELQAEELLHQVREPQPELGDD